MHSNKKLTIEDMKKLAETKGGKCLSNEYSNARTKLKWQCKEGHVWKTAHSNIKSGNWCPICSHKIGAMKRLKKALIRFDSK